MAGAMKKGDKIRQIVRLKQMLMRWRRLNLGRRTLLSSESHSCPLRRTPSGFVAVYIGPESKRFVIPTRFLNLPIFLALLKRAEDEFGFQNPGGLVLPCDVSFFTQITHYLHADEERYGKFSLDDFLKLVSDVASDLARKVPLLSLLSSRKPGFDS
ncbi:indole-3-acetic acid-induced protein ARG7-like [Neltuma alba]|uniref:indole-3-acetic acid-induced protein ARG7-like n=1 Tax=Neltuma alba TaxID=207710 RepID=UPI0010A2F459|nr:indole-3-acetic acid-induced protein ARG7-like [Prosopis alba]